MSTSVRTTAASLRVLLERSIDYAGLFAPASLDMRTSVDNYSRYLRHPQSWALGRFVLPVARLDEFLTAREGAGSGMWHLSAILSGLESDLAAADAFNRLACGAVIDAIEVRVSTPEEIELVREQQPPGTTAFFEIAASSAGELGRDDLPAAGLLRTLGCIGGCAKLRTGGVVPEAFPAVETIAVFLERCAHLVVPFKATAGLHHPLRGTHPLTYAANSPQASMHGFLNVFTAAAIAWETRRSVQLPTLATCLADPERANWHLGEDALTWSGDVQPVRIELNTLRAARSNFALSFGSCSFEEPIQEMRELDLL
jgi:hypothetical protein